MGKVTVYCIVSGCTPQVASDLQRLPYGLIVTSALKALADQHELRSQNDLCVIAPVDPDGQLLYSEDDNETPRASDIDPDTEIRVVQHCVMGDSWDFGSVDAPPPNEHRRSYLVSFGLALMVQTYALDIMALATRGRMTPLRLWRLAMQQGYEAAGHLDCLEGVNYGEIMSEWEQFPNPFPGFHTTPDGFEHPGLFEMEATGDLEVVKQQIMHEGQFWMWMAPDRFPVYSTEYDYPLWLPDAHLSASHSAIGSLPAEVFTSIVSFLPILSVFHLASASRSLRTIILGNDYLACIWLYNSAPWWIPVPTQTPKKDDPQATAPQVYLASAWGTHVQLTVNLPAGLDWAYVGRCLRSGSMRNRKRIWNAVLDIEHTADLASV